MIDRNELLSEAEELADLLVQCPEIEAYRRAEAVLKNHPVAQSKMNTLRDVQERIGEFQSRGVPEPFYESLIKQSESLLDQLEKIPEVASFLEAQNNVNELLQAVTSKLSQAIAENPSHGPGESNNSEESNESRV